ncbi:N-acetylmuramoyl-L-alanine amidase [Pseudovibrio sp. SPO723]|uniref:N-acetylmuramoyl-L-alanine amidase n=1 Tax=Nesiotobacter zosterae TaxID=392721 RepID=UPI0029C3BA8A|nr:N-acetylmuramoyl-L-alanine amidase [Pseudovibrio sp. SPO723]MDX5594022.1 N-acetylmuramoyl-L-alanine amidase [Pseudovibrio sp. SPO723]
MSVKPECGVPAQLKPSPNHNERAMPVDMLVLHYTGMPDHDEALARLCDPRSEVSAHYVVMEDGSIYQCVPEGRRAWHAGKAWWKGETDINSCSIGIEIANVGHDGGLPEYPEAQIEALIGLCKDILSRHDIPPARVLGHSDVAPDRKIDPGEKFPWERLYNESIGHFVAEKMQPQSSGFFQRGDEGAPIEAIQALLGLYGYHIRQSGVFDQKTYQAVVAFQRHFRPSSVDGVADPETITLLHSLLRGLPSL